MSNEVKNREEREKWVGLENLFQTLEFSQAMVAHAFNPSTREAETGGSL